MNLVDSAVTYLFVPGDRPERFVKAVEAGVDVVIVDIEDAVAPARKAIARSAIAEAWPPLSELAARRGAALCIRINCVRAEAFEEDLGLCLRLRPALVMVPKVESPEELIAVSAGLPTTRTLALIETATGVLEAPAIASAPGLARLVLGSVDLMLDLGVTDDRGPLDAARSMLVLASARAGIAGPVDGVCTTIEDFERIQSDAARARSFGFTGKLCIHPRQVAAVSRAFELADHEVSWAERVVLAAASSAGAATTVDGAMVDAPVILRAERILARAKALRTRQPPH
ncbi:HpcH/HpaI aldolase/citrate lyase family protein [Pararobbsia alpina]|uniref:Citrate lyase subunit beta-like protein n=1 Tax=Pararobbsia alpina TaxID=621374 RepID=A0A6S7BC48_9BURK|nr:CoA ester lyase [Pararobbsia alpina]CAB3786095.1 Citrate lyase subunit beta-like protein [Pararobbsia alpina]